MGALLLLCIPLRWLLAAAVSILVHEFGHWCVLRLCGYHVKQWQIGACGMRLMTGPLTPVKECLCALAGPLCGMMLVFAAPVWPNLAVCALVHSMFNLLPITGQDGYRIVLSFLTLCFGRKAAAAFLHILQLTAAVVGAVFCVWATFIRRLGLFAMLLGVYAFVKGIQGKKPCKLRQETVQW